MERVDSVSLPPGRFLWNVPRRTWAWDDALYRLFGYEPTAVVPDGELLLDHTAEPDRPDLLHHLDQVRDGSDVATTVHIHAAGGVVVPAATVGYAPTDEIDLRIGWVVPLDVENDPGGPVDRQVQNLKAAVASRDLIGQAKGVLRARMGIGDDAAFNTLRWISQNTNVRLVSVAESLLRHVAQDLWVDDADQQDFTRFLLDFVEGLRGQPAVSLAPEAQPGTAR